MRSFRTPVKLQSAMEYLVTYGWVIMVTAIALVGLYSLGVFGSLNSAPQQCVAPTGFECVTYAMNVNGIVRLTMLQDTSNPINVTGIGCYQSLAYRNVRAPYNPPSNKLYMPVGSQRNFTVQCYTTSNSLFSTNLGGVYNGSIVINYTLVNYLVSTQVQESTVGTIVVKASTSNSFPNTP